jgi:hypothetical protein
VNRRQFLVGSNGYGRTVSLAYSGDGIHWSRPDLGVRSGSNVVHPGSRGSAIVWVDLLTRIRSVATSGFAAIRNTARGPVGGSSRVSVHFSRISTAEDVRGFLVVTDIGTAS